jgi:hypothetical protein
MIGFRLVNFLPPQASPALSLRTSLGQWTLTQNANFQQSQSAILNNQCAETYIIVSRRDAYTSSIIRFR